MPTAPLVATPTQPGIPYRWSRQEYEKMAQPDQPIAVADILPKPRHRMGAA